MERFYVDSDAFIFETMVESCRIGKMVVMERIKERIQKYIEKNACGTINILMYGDGVGSDTIFLSQVFKSNTNFFYFDVPGSKTYEFAMKRFKKRNIKVEVLNNVEKIPLNFFDIVVCLEVLEHLPEPLFAIKKISDVLKENGICLLTESFDAVSPNFPTHLKKNLKYAYKTPFLFLKNNLYLTCFYKEEPQKRPMEFKKVKNIEFRQKINLYIKKDLIVPLILNEFKKNFQYIFRRLEI